MRGNDDFPCTKCGACCTVVDHNRLVDFYKKAAEEDLLDKSKLDKIERLPMRPDGTCLYLQKDRTCAIYQQRPEICRTLSSPLKPKEFSSKEWIAVNLISCNILMDQRKDIGEEYKIKMSEPIKELGQATYRRYTQLMENIQKKLKK
jgi:Fe-S-cluster containining protein|tara:strand:- start:494 stop:934 length:441 start_codon:yes stop_codon:yes gene_type:complete